MGAIPKSIIPYFIHFHYFVQLDAQWSLQSDFLLSLIRSPAFAGIVRARIVGFSADVSIKVIHKNCQFANQFR